MAGGLVALLDDVAALTKLAAASLDDVGAAAGKAGSKAMGVVIDDTAVTPNYVMQLSPERELPIIGKIALGSLRNKLLILLPAALLLSAFAPWAITPLLMLGGSFLCFEGAEKVIEALGGGHHDEADAGGPPPTPEALEAERVRGAVRTDLILSGEIMAISLAEVAASPIVTQAVVLLLVGIGLTIGVYGAVALIVKMDDLGVHLAREGGPAALRGFGRGLVKAMPVVMAALSAIGTAAMVWVGGQIVVHGIGELGLHAPAATIEHAAAAAGATVPALHAAIEWLVGAIGSGIVGLVLGGIIALAVAGVRRLRG